MMEDRKRVGLYARIRQADALDLTMQTLALESYARLRGWDVVLNLQEIGPECANRFPARSRLLQVADAGELDVVLVYKLDRFAGSLSELVDLIEGLQARGVSLVTFAEDFDLSAPEGPRIRRLLQVLEHFQRTTHKDQVQAGLIRARRSGNPIGRPAGSKIHLEKVRALAESGLSQREIARQLGLHPRTISRLLGNAIPSGKD